MMPISEYLQFVIKSLITVAAISVAMYFVFFVWEYDYDNKWIKGIPPETVYVHSGTYPFATSDDLVYEDLFNRLKESGAITRQELSSAQMKDGSYFEGPGSKRFSILVTRWVKK